MVYEAIINNLGCPGLNRITAALSVPPMTQGKFDRYTRYLYKRMNVHYEDCMKTGVQAVFEHYLSTGARPDPATGLLDIAVSYDGTWPKRGHSSHIGASFIIEIETGLVIDFETMCNFCRICSSKKKSLSAEDFDIWKEKHQRLCHKNFDGQATTMETVAATRLWQRSISYKLRYTTFLSDGDSSAYNAVCGLNDGQGPYDIKVEKEECVNHVCKRMGTRLRKLKQEDFTTITTKTGKKMKRSVLGGAHMLTDKVIDNLQRYYQKAVRDNRNKTVKSMRDGIMASYFHSFSTDDAPQLHKLCPKSEESWCFYNRALAKGEAPPTHEEKKPFLAKIPEDKRQGILNIYRDLTKPELLHKCLKGRTQNPNESLHSKVWRKCTKCRWAGPMRVKFVAQATILDHNFGYEKTSLLTHMGFGASAPTLASLQIQEKQRRTPTSSKKKKKTTKKTADYSPGAF